MTILQKPFVRFLGAVLLMAFGAFGAALGLLFLLAATSPKNTHPPEGWVILLVGIIWLVAEFALLGGAVRLIRPLISGLAKTKYPDRTKRQPDQDPP